MRGRKHGKRSWGEVENIQDASAGKKVVVTVPAGQEQGVTQYGLDMVTALMRLRAAIGDTGKTMIPEMIRNAAAKIAELEAWERFGGTVLERAKDEFSDNNWNEDIEWLMELAQSQRVGNVRRVIYDPHVHGNIDADEGAEIWFWGDELTPGEGERGDG